MVQMETEDCKLAILTAQPDARGTVLMLSEEIKPLHILSRWWPGPEADAWASMSYSGERFFCVSGRAEVTLLSFRRYRTLCPASFVLSALVGAHERGMPGGLPGEMDCLTETVILDSHAPRLLTVPPDVFVFIRTTALPTVLLTSINPDGPKTVRLASRFAEAVLG